MPPATGLRERKKQATRRALAAAAVRLVAERGLEGVTVDDISDAADVSPRTFFNYFDSKEEALLGGDPERLEQLRSDLLARPAEEPPLAALRSVLAVAADRLTDDVEAWRLRQQVLAANPTLLPRYQARFAVFERGLADAVATRLSLPADHPYPALVVAVTVTALRVAIGQWRGDGPAGLQRALDTVFASLADGLTPPVR